MKKLVGRFVLILGLAACACAIIQAGGTEALRDVKPERFLEGEAKLPTLATPVLLVVGSILSLTGSDQEKE